MKKIFVTIIALFVLAGFSTVSFAEETQAPVKTPVVKKQKRSIKKTTVRKEKKIEANQKAK